MHPELFQIPFTTITVKTYGVFLVIGFLAIIFVAKRLSRDFTPNQELITNAGLYALIIGLTGGRIFYVIHYFDKFKDNILSVFYIWQGGYELLGGAIWSILFLMIYIKYHKLPIRRYLDVIAIGLLVLLGFGRIGCFFSGCCYGKPCESPLAIKFPYASSAYLSQITPNPSRNRLEPYFELPTDYFGYSDENGNYYNGLKPFDKLSLEQKLMVTKGVYTCLPVHPTQLYSSGLAFFGAFLLYLHWKRNKNIQNSGKTGFFAKHGCVFALMFILYGIGRFFIEFLRDDNPFEFDGLTVSQNISIGMFIAGIILMLIFNKMAPYQPQNRKQKSNK
jgi:phosphatidylglycerol:prolipoprotein diacylglycerol transferase